MLSRHEGSCILAGDIGGTNTTLALTEVKNGKIEILGRRPFQSQKLRGIEEALDEALPEFRTLLGSRALVGACFTAAGPVANNTCQLTNVSWSIEGAKLSRKLGAEVHIINDLSGICYGIPLINHQDESHVVRLGRPDGVFPPTQELYPGTEVRAVVAPGTGLGIGYLLRDRGSFLAIPAEAGHIDFAPWSDEAKEVHSWVKKRVGRNPGVELFVSGQGLENIFDYLVASGASSPQIEEIVAHPKNARGALISKHAASDPTCLRTMELFVEFLARLASSVACWMLPKAGLYISGGIPAKNIEHITRGHRFMKLFLDNYQAGIEDQLRQVPVFLTLDYGINLQGAAHGFLCLKGRV